MTKELTKVTGDGYTIAGYYDRCLVDINITGIKGIMTPGARGQFEYNYFYNCFGEYRDIKKDKQYTIKIDGTLIGQKSEVVGKVPNFDNISKEINKLKYDINKKFYVLTGDNYSVVVKDNNTFLVYVNEGDVKCQFEYYPRYKYLDQFGKYNDLDLKKDKHYSISIKEDGTLMGKSQVDKDEEYLVKINCFDKIKSDIELLKLIIHPDKEKDLSNCRKEVKPGDIREVYTIKSVEKGYFVIAHTDELYGGFFYYLDGGRLSEFRDYCKMAELDIKNDGTLFEKSSRYVDKIPYFNDIMRDINQLKQKKRLMEQVEKEQGLVDKVDESKTNKSVKGKAAFGKVNDILSEKTTMKKETLQKQIGISLSYNKSNNSYEIDNGKIKGKLYAVSLEHKTYLGKLDIQDGAKTKTCTLQRDGTILNGAYKLIDKFDGVEKLVKELEARYIKPSKQIISNVVKPLANSANSSKNRITNGLLYINLNKLQFDGPNANIMRDIEGYLRIFKSAKSLGHIKILPNTFYLVDKSGYIWENDEPLGIRIKGIDKVIEEHICQFGVKKISAEHWEIMEEQINVVCSNDANSLMRIDLFEGCYAVLGSDYKYEFYFSHNFNYYYSRYNITRDGEIIGKGKEIIGKDLASIRQYFRYNNERLERQRVREQKEREYSTGLIIGGPPNEYDNNKSKSNTQQLSSDSSKQGYRMEEPIKLDILKFVFSGRIRHRGNMSFIEDSRGNDIGKIWHNNGWSSICDIWDNQVGKIYHYDGWSSVCDVWGNEVGKIHHQGEWSFIEASWGKDYGKAHTNNGLTRIDR